MVFLKGILLYLYSHTQRKKGHENTSLRKPLQKKSDKRKLIYFLSPSETSFQAPQFNTIKHE